MNHLNDIQMSHLMRLWYFLSPCKHILQMRMHSHPVGLDVWFLVRPFVYYHTSLVVYGISTIITWARWNIDWFGQQGFINPKNVIFTKTRWISLLKVNKPLFWPNQSSYLKIVVYDNLHSIDIGLTLMNSQKKKAFSVEGCWQEDLDMFVYTRNVFFTDQSVEAI